jgi:peptide-methionine (S)-S-oxide reductase
LQVGAAGDGDNSDHSLSAFRAARYSIHETLPNFSRRNAELAFLFQPSVWHRHIFAHRPAFGFIVPSLHRDPKDDAREGLRRIDMAVLTERAVLAGGCFWGVQDLLRRYPGVISTRVGYTGGEVPNATYRNHGNHAEAIEITFDPQIISYGKLLEFFFQIHDPSTLNRQGNDRGASYRSAIFYANDEQRRIAEDTIADVDASGLWPGKVVTEVAPVGPFWEAEPEHQDYLEKYPDGYTCHFIRPEWTLPHRQEAGRKMAG